ncbi:class I SAM-dependent methyltransferase [Jiulongibacter sediminis]|uniref:class I SAM-dependent methyltransferase n=1 Tax=Jiulongibacter sediminis TaxID=1605367 RepID=UPI0026EA6C1D|nr:class I SAM-dependent methyltransferase [Jiulongibacter sediminis]
MKFYPALKYHFLTPFYDVIIKLLMPEKRIKTRAISFLNPLHEERVLDFGCGTGSLLELLSQKGLKLQLVGLDPDPAILKMAITKIGDRAKFIQLDTRVLPFQNAAFEKIISSWVFHHLRDDDKLHYLRELRRVLTDGGTMIIADWGQPSSRMQHLFCFVTRLFDNFETFENQVNGRFPCLMEMAGFQVTVLGEEKTILGTLKYWQLCPR